MQLELFSATLIKRYKRFLADVTLEDHVETTIHCANTGAMTGCATPKDTVFYSKSTNTKRKYPYSWELTKTAQQHIICVNTQRANQLVEEALSNGSIAELTNFSNLKREVKYGNENSKADFYLNDENGVDTFIEVKSATLLHNDQGFFPDAKTLRGQKHLRELIDVVKSGKRAVLIFAALHSGISSIKPAEHIDPIYAKLLQESIQSGVEVYAYKADFNVKMPKSFITLTTPIPVIIT